MALSFKVILAFFIALEPIIITFFLFVLSEPFAFNNLHREVTPIALNYASVLHVEHVVRHHVSIIDKMIPEEKTTTELKLFGDSGDVILEELSHVELFEESVE